MLVEAIGSKGKQSRVEKENNESSRRRVSSTQGKVQRRGLPYLDTWRQGLFIVGFCLMTYEQDERLFFEKPSESKTFGHIYYIDLYEHRTNYYYKLEIDKTTESKPTRLKEQFYSLRLKALSYYCHLSGTKSTKRRFQKCTKELTSYRSRVTDLEFKKLTSVPPTGPVGLGEVACKLPVTLRNPIEQLSLLDCSSVMPATETVKYQFPDTVHTESRSGLDLSSNYCWSEGDLKRTSEKSRIVPEADSAYASDLVSLFVPLPHAGSYEVLEGYAQCCKVLRDVPLPENEAATTGLNCAWEGSGFYAHRRHFTKLAVFIASLVVSTLTFADWSTSYPRVALGIQVLVLVLVGCLFMEEALDLIHVSRHLSKDRFEDGKSHSVLKWSIKPLATLTAKHFFFDPWSAFDLTFFTVTIVGTVYRTTYWTDSITSTSCLAVAILVAWTKAVYFLQALRQTGPLVAMIVHTTKEVTPLFAVLLMTLTGPASAPFLLSERDETLPLGTTQGGLLSALDYMLGNFSSDLSGTVGPQLATILFILYMLTAPIVVFSLLVAIVSSAYTEVQVLFIYIYNYYLQLQSSTSELVKAEGLSHWRFEQATPTLEPKRKLPTKYTDAVKTTYSKTTDRTYAWYQQSEKVVNSSLDLLEKIKDQLQWPEPFRPRRFSGGLWGLKSPASAVRTEDPNFGEGCYPHVLQRRSTSQSQGGEDETSRRTTATGSRTKDTETRMDATLRALSTSGNSDDSLKASSTNGKKN